MKTANFPPFHYVLHWTTESILTSCLTVWYGNCTVLDRMALQQIMRTAKKMLRLSLPTIDNSYQKHCIHMANSIVDDHSLMDSSTLCYVA